MFLITKYSMRYTVVTTFHQTGLEEYGQRMIDTFEQYWPTDVDLVIYAENCQPKTKRDNTYVYDIFEVSPACTDFVARHKDNPEAHGSKGQHNIKIWNPKKSFRWDAVRFSYKVFALEHAINHINSDWVIWIDADTLTHSAVTDSWLTSVCPTTSMVSYLGRNNYHSECGWIAYNKNHRNCNHFVNSVANMYKQDKIFNYPEWHDSYIWDRVREQFQNKDNVFYNINPQPECRGFAGHPFINSALGLVMDHVKGARKEQGHSRNDEIVSHRTHPYWQKILEKGA